MSCENSDDTTNVQNENSVEKHFVTIEQIKQIVENRPFQDFLSKFKNNEILRVNNVIEDLTISDFTEYKDKNDVTAFYLTQLTDNSIVLFAADDRSHTIMGVTDFNDPNALLADIPEEFNYWLEEEIEAIEFARDNYLVPTDEVETEWLSYKLPPPPPPPYECTNEFHETKWPLLTTTWGQGYGYNNYTPNLGCSNYSNGNAPTGCVATATAQVMKYFQHPATYNWSAMPNNFGSNATSQLMVDIGSTSSMDYGCDGSGTKLYKLVRPNPFQLSNNPFKNVFGYTNALFGDFNRNTVVSELSQNKPVIMSGGEKKYWAGLIPYYADGHAWVADGYMRGFACFYDNYGNVNGGYGYLLFHLNWGWGYSYRHLNGFFGFNNFSVNGDSYNYKRKMIYGIRK